MATLTANGCKKVASATFDLNGDESLVLVYALRSDGKILRRSNKTKYTEWNTYPGDIDNTDLFVRTMTAYVNNVYGPYGEDVVTLMDVS